MTNDKDLNQLMELIDMKKATLLVLLLFTASLVSGKKYNLYNIKLGKFAKLEPNLGGAE